MFWIFFTLLFAAESDETDSQESILYSAETAKPGDGNQNEWQLNVFTIKELKIKQIDRKSKSNELIMFWKLSKLPLNLGNSCSRITWR